MSDAVFVRSFKSLLAPYLWTGEDRRGPNALPCVRPRDPPPSPPRTHSLPLTGPPSPYAMPVDSICGVVSELRLGTPPDLTDNTLSLSLSPRIVFIVIILVMTLARPAPQDWGASRRASPISSFSGGGAGNDLSA